MSVIIEEYDNPKSCLSCPFSHDDCWCSITHGEIDRDDYSCDKSCPIKPLPEHYGRLIDADKTLTIAWHKFWKQEEEHEKTIEGYDILRDRFYEQAGFECCQQAIVNAEPIIPATKPPRWIERRLQMGLHDWMCSVCKCQCEETVRICPNCGVDTGGRYEMEENDGGYWFEKREQQTATKGGEEDA